MALQSKEMDAKKIGIGIQARLSSTRLPGKILKEVKPGLTLLESCVNQAGKLRKYLNHEGYRSKIAILCPIVDWPEIYESIQKKTTSDPGKKSIDIIAAPDVKDVFARYRKFMQKYDFEYLIRITADCPLWSPLLAHKLFRLMKQEGADYAQIKTPDDYPDGFDVEIIRADLWKKMLDGRKNTEILEHVTIGLKKPNCGTVKPEKAISLPPDIDFQRLVLGGIKLSIDTEEDLKRIQTMISEGEVFWTTL